MKLIFYFFLFFSCLLKAQQPSPLSFTMNYASYTPSITCTRSFVPIVLQSNYTVSPVTYSWTNGTATFTGSLVNVTSPGNYSITAYANPTLTLVQTLSIPINTTAPSVSLSPLSQSITCSSSTASVLALTNSNYAMHYFSSAFGGSFSILGDTATYFPGMPGTYTHVVVDALNGCKTQSTFTVTSNSAFPTFSLSSAQNFTLGCDSKSTAVVSILSNSVNPSGGTFSYTMTSVSNYSTGPVTTYSYLASNAGNYTIVVKDDVSLCESKLPLTVIANTYVPIPFVYNGHGAITCKQPSLFSTIIHTEPGNYTYAWSTPFSFTLPILFNHPYDTLTIFPDTAMSTNLFNSPWALIKDNATECWLGLSSSLDIDILPPKVGIKTNRNYISCKYPSTVITCSVQSTSPSWNPGPVSATLWEGPSPQVNGTLSSGYLAQTPGIYTVHVVDWQSGCTNTDTILIKDLRNHPILNASSNPLELCNSQVTLQVLSSADPVEFEWYVPGGSMANTIIDEFVATAPGIYTVIATDPSNGCSSLKQFTVLICTGIESIEKKQAFSVFPNPTNDYVFVKAGNNQTLIVTDALSRIILEQKIDNALQRIDLSKYPAGIYFISIREKDQQLTCVKVIRKD